MQAMLWTIWPCTRGAVNLADESFRSHATAAAMPPFCRANVETATQRPYGIVHDRVPSQNKEALKLMDRFVTCFEPASAEAVHGNC